MCWWCLPFFVAVVLWSWAKAGMTGFRMGESIEDVSTCAGFIALWRAERQKLPVYAHVIACGPVRWPISIAAVFSNFF